MSAVTIHTKMGSTLVCSTAAHREARTARKTNRAIRAQSVHGLTLPGGLRLVFDGSYFLLTPSVAR